MSKLDYKKNIKELYLPKAEPVIVEALPMTFIMAGGTELQRLLKYCTQPLNPI